MVFEWTVRLLCLLSIDTTISLPPLSVVVSLTSRNYLTAQSHAKLNLENALARVRAVTSLFDPALLGFWTIIYCSLVALGAIHKA